MRKNSTQFILLLLILVFCFSSKSQAQEAEVEKQLDSLTLKMFDNVNNRDYDAIMEMTHPKVFELVPKEMMINVFKSMFEGNEEFSIALSDEIPEYNISEVFRDEENATDYAFVNYDMEMSMTFKGEDFDDEGKEMMVNMMKLQGMDAKFVSDNTLDINMPNRMVIMLKDETTADKWVMINYDPDSPLFYQILSAPLLEKAKDYYQDLLIADKKKE